MKKIFVFFILFIGGLLCFKYVDTYDINDYVAANKSEVVLDKKSISISVGSTVKLNVTNNSSLKLVWVSSNKKIVTVDSNGNIKGVGVGTASIIVAAKNNYSIRDVCTVTVTKNNASTSSNVKVNDIQIDSTSMTMKVGGTGKISYSVLPANATNKLVNFVSSNSSVVSVDNSGNIKALKEGSAVITITSVANSSIKKSFTIMVKNDVVAVNSIKLNVEEKTLNYGDTFKLYAIVGPENATNKAVSWRSSNPDVLSVDNNGNIKVIMNWAGKVTVKAISSSNKSVNAVAVITINGKLKKLGKININASKGVIVATQKKGITSAQGFCVADNYYVAAKRNGNETKSSIMVINKKNNTKVNSFVINNGTLGHANGLTYNPNTGMIYSVMTKDENYRSFTLKDILKKGVSTKSDAFYLKNKEGKVVPVSFSAIAYDNSVNNYYLAKGGRIYVYDDKKNLIRKITKVSSDVPQDIGAYNGKILVVRHKFKAPVGGNSLTNTRNTIDIYRSSNGEYLGSYIINVRDELQSVDYYGSGNNFSIFVNNVPKCGDCIYKIQMNIPK
ncbi:MAG: Ig-like domain-containing protein [Bacilli bacterium]|nr:Ig-like domain-containing protein [Bacilli bacterium]